MRSLFLIQEGSNDGELNKAIISMLVCKPRILGRVLSGGICVDSHKNIDIYGVEITANCTLYFWQEVVQAASMSKTLSTVTGRDVYYCAAR